MIKLSAETIYLAALEKEDCVKLWNDSEYDFENPTELLNIGHSVIKADEWFTEIQKLHGNTHVRLGIFLNDGAVIGDVALQDINKSNRSASLGMGMAKLENRNKGYGGQAAKLMIEYGFYQLGLERITASTLEMNVAAQKSLEKLGFVLEGKVRKAEYFGGKRYDKYSYGLLVEEYRQ